ncbi:hypothetical protein, partial [uncultured Flavonifractor sp.]|uniref:hypothetical protein n=1 Tax=uncultured Flavonifractor sp. TaxID=1193534 RepID=UPI00266F2573
RQTAGGVKVPWSYANSRPVSSFLPCNSVLAVFHKMYGIPKGVCFVEDKVTYMIDKDEINQQKMHLTITNRRPQYLRKSQEAAKREIERQLFKIFQKYV